MIAPKAIRGKVILAGAGPGDPELMTLKALRFLREADVIITDRLVSQELFSENVKEGVTILYVGKHGGSSERSTSQQKINELLVEHALQDKLVLRLKGGDVSFFSNVLDELETLTRNNIPYEIVPGVTAGSGAAAYAGIPLTARGYATSVRFLTCYSPEDIDREHWRELAATDDTLVFYMTSGALKSVVVNLLDQHISQDKGLAVIEQATTPFQKVYVYSLTEFAAINSPSFVSPTMVIIGRVVSLHNQFNWVPNSVRSGSYFSSLKNVSTSEKMH